MCVGRALVRVTSQTFPATATATTATDAQTFRLDDRCDRATPLSLEREYRERESTERERERERERSKKICQNNKIREEKKERKSM